MWGLGVAAVAAAASLLVNRAVPAVSALLVAILLGTALSHGLGARGIPQRIAPGLTIASRRLLRLGIVLLGLQLGLADISGLGWPMMAGAALVVAGGLLATLVLGRVLGVSVDQSILIASGFSICGAAAVAGMESVMAHRRRDEAATAIALVVAFGTLMIALMPATRGLMHLNDRTAGIWTGASVQEVAQVVAAGAIIGSPALKVAVVVKLARVLLLAPVLAITTWTQHRGPRSHTGKRPPLVPLFVAGFLAMVVVRSAGVLGAPALAAAKVVETGLLAAAMFALGTAVHWTVVRRAGGRAVALAALATGVVFALGGAVAAFG